jgi:putative ABC transport system ATP-binding protein
MIHLKNLAHFFQQNQVLNIPEWTAEQGEHWLLLGNSGSGKTTLLHILAGLRQASKGEVIVLGQNIQEVKGAKLDRFRARNIGLVFQRPHLIQTLTVMQNLQLAQYMAGLKQDKNRCEEVLKQLNIWEKRKSYPNKLSQGQAQRVSVARAVLNHPKILLADEPTASLDDANTQQVIDLLKTQALQYQASLIIATHDQRIKESADFKVLSLD